MACTTASGITLDCKDSKGGLEVLYIAPWAALAYSPTISASVITAWPGAASLFYKFELRCETAKAGQKAPTNKDNGTQFFEQSGDYKAEKMSATKDILLTALAQKRNLIIYKDNNGKYFLHGYDHGADLNYEQGTGTKLDEFNGYLINWLAREKISQLEISSGIVAALIAA